MPSAGRIVPTESCRYCVWPVRQTKTCHSCTNLYGFARRLISRRCCIINCVFALLIITVILTVVNYLYDHLKFYSIKDKVIARPRSPVINYHWRCVQGFRTRRRLYRVAGDINQLDQLGPCAPGLKSTPQWLWRMINSKALTQIGVRHNRKRILPKLHPRLTTN